MVPGYLESQALSENDMPRRVLVGHQVCDGRGMNGIGMEAARGGRWWEKSRPTIPSYNEIIVRAIQDPGGILRVNGTRVVGKS